LSDLQLSVTAVRGVALHRIKTHSIGSYWGVGDLSNPGRNPALNPEAYSNGRTRPDSVCPVSGEPVLARPEWTDIRLGDDYGLTVELIGRGIVYSRPSGLARLPGMRRAMAVIADVVRGEIGDGRPYVHVGDFSELRGVTLRARRYYIDFMRNRRDLAGVVYCGVSPAFRWTIQIGRRLGIVNADVAIVENRDQAIKLAVGILKGASERAPSTTSTNRRSPETRPEWEYRGSGYAIRFEVLDDLVAHGVTTGYVGSDHIEPTMKLCRRVASHIASRGAPIRAIIDVSRLEKITTDGRRAFVKGFKELQDDQPIQLLVFCGANVLLRGALAIWRPLLRFPVITARDFDSALQLVRDGGRRKSRLTRIFGMTRGSSSETGASSTERQMNDLLRFLGTIDWEQDGVTGDIQPFPGDEPLAPIFDAVTLLKAELDQQLRDRRTAEAALRQSEERYRTILDDIVDGYYEIDLVGNVTFCNNSMLRILGYRRDELKNLKARSYMDRQHSKRVISEFFRVFDTERPARALSWELIRKDGQRIGVESSISLIRDQTGRKVGFRGIVRDITERVHAERERDELETKLLHAQRMESIGTLAGGISHNFNNLLMGIQGNVSLVRRELEAEHPTQRRLSTVEDLVQDGSRLTRQLLGYARAGRYEIRVIDLNQLVARTSETFGLARKEIRLHMDLAVDLPPVLADRGQIEQVLLNMFVNGAEAMPLGGDIFISTELTSQESSQGGRHDATPGSYIRLCVRDTGVGMSGETVQRIFDPFFTTKGMSGGTGLGLASVYGTINAHGGYIEVNSEEGVGSTFAVYLPSTQENITQSRAADGEVVLGQGTVLVVDDDQAVLEACASILSHLRYNPVCASTGDEAIEVFRNRADEIDMVILDMILPDIGGGDVYDALRTIDPDAIVLLSSGYSLDGQAERILERGCNDFIQKPFTVEQLSQKMGAVLGRS